MSDMIETVEQWISYYEELGRAAKTNPDQKVREHMAAITAGKLDALRALREKHGGDTKLAGLLDEEGLIK